LTEYSVGFLLIASLYLSLLQALNIITILPQNRYLKGVDKSFEGVPAYSQMHTHSFSTM
jgi:hypothetical protein